MEVAETILPVDGSVAATIAQMEQSRTYVRASRSGLTQLLSTEAIGLATTFETNIVRHYKTRVHKFVRWTFKPEERLPHDDHMQLKTEMAQVTHDLCRHAQEPFTSPEAYHIWVDAYRDMFGLDTLLATESLTYALKAAPHLFLRSMRMMCRTFERNGLRTFALVPLTTRLRPGFVSFDTRSIGEVLHLGQTQDTRDKNKARGMKREAERKAGTYKTRAELKQMTDAHRQVQKDAAAAAREAQRVADVQLSKQDRTAVKKRRREEAAERKVEARARKIVKRHADLDAYTSKRAFYAGFAHLRVRPARGFVFGHSFRTDGVSVRLLFERPTPTSKEELSTLPRRGLFAIDEIKRLSKISAQEMQIIGVDPGMIDLIHCVDPERVLDVKLPDDPPATVVYTSARRRHETCSVLYSKRMQMEKQDEPAVRGAEDAMCAFDKHSTERSVLHGYFDTRRAAMPSLLEFYGAMRYRARRWRSFQKEQRSIHRLISEIESMRTKDTMVLAYGSAVRAISNLKTRGVAPCINMGLRRRLSKHFLVADTPEHYTSKTCSACHGCCGPFEALETCRREELKAKATTDHEKKKAAYHKIRGLRRCQNAECGVILHRDRNAASNIAENFYRLYEGKPCLGKLTAQETALHEALGKLED